MRQQRMPLVCSVLQPARNGGVHQEGGVEDYVSVRMQVRRLLSPLPLDSAIAPSLRTSLVGDGCGR